MTAAALPSQAEVDDTYALAQSWCGACRDYHATRPLLVASGIRAGPERDREVFAPLLRQAVPRHGRILLAGAADTGLLRFVLSVVGERDPRVTVADRCATPLELCRRHAATQGLAIATAELDLTAASGLGPFDVVVSHAALSFVSTPLQPLLLSALGAMLVPSGVLIAAYPLPRTGPSGNGDFLETLRDGVAATGLRPPAGFFEAAQRVRAEYRTNRQPGGGAPDAVPGLLADAGFETVEQRDSLSPARPIGASHRWTFAPRRYLVARRRPDAGDGATR